MTVPAVIRFHDFLSMKSLQTYTLLIFLREDPPLFISAKTGAH